MSASEALLRQLIDGHGVSSEHCCRLVRSPSAFTCGLEERWLDQAGCPTAQAIGAHRQAAAPRGHHPGWASERLGWLMDLQQLVPGPPASARNCRGLCPRLLSDQHEPPPSRPPTCAEDLLTPRFSPKKSTKAAARDLEPPAGRPSRRCSPKRRPITTATHFERKAPLDRLCALAPRRSRLRELPGALLCFSEVLAVSCCSRTLTAPCSWPIARTGRLFQARWPRDEGPPMQVSSNRALVAEGIENRFYQN